jgi:phage-related protein
LVLEKVEHCWLKGKVGLARALYVTAREQRVVILRAFMKKTEKTPPAEIELRSSDPHAPSDHLRT